MERPSRLEATRRKLRLARYVVVAGAAAAFGGFALVARAGHPGNSTASPSTASVAAQSSGLDRRQRVRFAVLRLRIELARARGRQHALRAEQRLMSSFRSMGCEIVLAEGLPSEPAHALFDARERRFSRFLPSSELNRVNAAPLGVRLVSEEFASMLSLALDAARATGGLVTPAVGGAITAAGYDRDFADLSLDGEPVEPAAVHSLAALRLRGRMLLRSAPVVLDLNGVVKGRTVDDALALLGDGWVCAGGDLATTVPLEVALPAGGSVRLIAGGLATSSVGRRTWLRGGIRQHHLIDPASGRPADTPWRDVTVSAGSCVAADIAAKAALLLGAAGPAWLDGRGLAGRFVAGNGEVTDNDTWRRSTTRLPLAA